MSSSPEPAQGRQGLSPALQAIRRQWWIVVLFALLIPAWTLVFAILSEPTYRSTAKVLISDRDLAGAVSGVPTDALDSSASVATEAQIASLPSVVRKAKESLGNPDSGPGQSATVALKVASTPNTSGESNILNIEADSSSRVYSQQLASAVADQYVSFRRALATRDIRAARTDLASRVAELTESGGTGSALYTDLRGRLQQLDTLLILGSAKATVLEGGEEAVQVSPQPIRSTVLGLLAGLLIGVCAALVLDRLDRRVRSHDDIAAMVGAPILSTLPNPKRKDGLPNLVTRSSSASPEAEAFRALRTHMKFALATRSGKSVIITSAEQGEGKTFVATNLSISAAAAGDDVILVDLDLRKPMAHRYLALPHAPGLSDVIAGDTTLEDALVTVPLPEHASRSGRLRFLPAGRRIPNPGELVASEAVATQLRRLVGADVDMIVIDTPPVLPVSDATAIAAVADATAIVVRADQARRPTLGRLRSLLQSGGHHPVGLILTASWSRRSGYGERYTYSSAEVPEADVADSGPPASNGGTGSHQSRKVQSPY